MIYTHTENIKNSKNGEGKLSELKNRIALVTGSTTGIGLTIAHHLAQAGAQVVLNGLATDQELKELLDDFEKNYGYKPVFIACDLRDPAQIKAMIQTIENTYGKLDILVNNAGIQHVSPISDFPAEIWDDMLAINLSASFHTIRHTLPIMKKTGWGRIINMASISGLRGRANKPAYNATKHGLIGLTKSVAIELAPTAITCNAICPGWVHTPLVQTQIDALAKRDGLDNETATQRLIGLRQPSGKFVTKEQIADLVLFFCSPTAAEVRGVAWEIDGGTTAQ